VTYVVPQEDLEHALGREFGFLAAEGFAGPTIERSTNGFRAGFDRGDVTVDMHCDAECSDLMTVVARPQLRRQLLLETIHALNVGDSRYPTATGGAWQSQDAFDRRIALEAELLRESLDAATRDDALYEEAGGRA
jgi:hypothetical protein